MGLKSAKAAKRWLRGVVVEQEGQVEVTSKCLLQACSCLDERALTTCCFSEGFKPGPGQRCWPVSLRAQQQVQQLQAAHKLGKVPLQHMTMHCEMAFSRSFTHVPCCGMCV